MENTLDIENLRAAAEFVRNIPGRYFDMETYREGYHDNTICNSVGCALGHLTALFPELVEYGKHGDIKFWEIPYSYFGMTDDKAINYCFASEWHVIDNTTQGCADRIIFVAEHGEKAAREEWRKICDEYKLVF